VPNGHPCTRLPCGRVGIEIVPSPQSGIAVGMLEGMERLKSRELDGMFDPYLELGMRVLNIVSCAGILRHDGQDLVASPVCNQSTALYADPGHPPLGV
jgi:hypothetical protein